MEKLIIKYLTDTISEKELNLLKDWLGETKNKEYFKTFVNANRFLENEYANINIEVAYQKIIKQTGIKEKPVKNLYKKFFKYAATILILVSAGYFYQQGYFSENNSLIIANENVTLELENGEVKAISEQTNMSIVNTKGAVVGNQKGSTIAYNTSSEVEKLIYNTLTVPYGKRFELFLSDGTHVHLNAGSTFKYPVKFLPNQKRQVYLTGEGYFDVAKDVNNIFVVNVEKSAIEVYGTRFNVSAYTDDVFTDVVLVEGKVTVIIENRKAKTRLRKKTQELKYPLKPGYKGIINKQNIGSYTQNKVNTSNYTSWVQGKLIFKNTSFKNMLRKMERHFNVTIVNSNKELDEEIYNANFGNISIYEVMKGLNTNYGIQYTIKENKIFIN